MQFSISVNEKITFLPENVQWFYVFMTIILITSLTESEASNEENDTHF